MAYIYKNITGNTAEVLYSISDLKEYRVKTITLANIHATDKVSIDLYLRGNRTKYAIHHGKDFINHSVESNDYEFHHSPTSIDTYYMYKAVVIPIGTTLQLESKDLYIDYNNVVYDIYIKLSASDSAVDVIINS